MSDAPMLTKENKMTEAQIKHMVDRFLGWRLPQDFTPDAGISYTRPNYHHSVDTGPSGTNLFHAAQAEEMVRYMLENLPPESIDENEIPLVLHPYAREERNVAGGWGFDELRSDLINVGPQVSAKDARIKELEDALEPFAQDAWLIAYTELTNRTVIAHVHGERGSELVLESDHFRRAARIHARKGPEECEGIPHV